MGAEGESFILENHDGFVETFYHLLWAKNFNGEPCPEVLVPDTIIYKYRIPAFWYFTGADGRLRRKNKSSIVNQKIYKDFTAGARSDKDVVACHICERPLDPDADIDFAKATETVIRYFDRASLKDFLFSTQKHDDGCLQKFVRPKGLFNSMIQAAWSPQMCLLERRVNLCPLLSGRAPLQERTATYEGSEHLSRITPVRGTLLADRVQHLCMEMASHIAATSMQHHRISRMLVNFKTDEEDHVWFLWCSSVRVFPPEGDDAAPTGAASPQKQPKPKPLSPKKAAEKAAEKAAAAAAAAAGGGGGGGADAPTGAPAAASPSLGASSRSNSQYSLMSANKPAAAPLGSVLAPCCLNPAMSAPSVPPASKAQRSAESVCPYTGRPLGERSPYFVTYKTILDYSNALDARSRTRRGWADVPPLLQKVCPDLYGATFARERANPLSLFLFTRVLVSEEAYLEFSTTAMPGLQVLPAITGALRKKMLAPSASAPVLPALDKKGSSGFQRQASTNALRGAPLKL